MVTPMSDASNSSPTYLFWQASYRIIRTIYPPVDLFEDVADPALWDALTNAEAKLNPRVREQVGHLSLVPVARRVGGHTASIAMGPFTHTSIDRPSRFSNGSFGVWYCGDRWEVALAETAHHFERFMRLTSEPAGEADYRELICSVGGKLHDIRAASEHEACHAPDDWGAGQALGRGIHTAGGDGVAYRSVRWETGSAMALFWPDLIKLPIQQARQFRYSWDGKGMTKYFIHGDDRSWQNWPPPRQTVLARP